MKKTFEEFLQDKFMEDYHGTKDNCEDAEERWFENLDVQEVIDYAEEWGSEKKVETFNPEDILVAHDKFVAKLTEQYQCPSYFDDSNTLINCTCGKCK